MVTDEDVVDAHGEPALIERTSESAPALSIDRVEASGEFLVGVGDGGIVEISRHDDWARGERVCDVGEHVGLCIAIHRRLAQLPE